jgi:hypothetical protein
MSALLHPAFREFGRSGKTYTRDEVLSEFTGSPQSYSVWAQDFLIDEIGDGAALLTNRSAHINPADELDRHTLKSSLWLLTPCGWKMRFHQGTPTEAFAKHPA